MNIIDSYIIFSLGLKIVPNDSISKFIKKEQESSCQNSDATDLFANLNFFFDIFFLLK